MTVSKEEVFDILSDKGWHTKDDIAQQLGCGRRIVSARVRELCEDKWVVLMGSEGYCLTEASDITDEDVARSVEQMTRYMIGTIARQAISAKPMKKLMTAARKILPKTADERLAVRKYLVQLTHLIDFQDIDDAE